VAFKGYGKLTGAVPCGSRVVPVLALPFVGSWHSSQIPRLSTLRRRLSPTAVEPSGYGTLAEYWVVLVPVFMTAFEPCATWQVVQVRFLAVVCRYMKIASPEAVLLEPEGAK
jgi:hypothetical protein